MTATAPAPTATATGQPPAGGTSSNGEALVEVEGLQMFFPVTQGILQRRVGWVRAVDDVTLRGQARRDAGARR